MNLSIKKSKKKPGFTLVELVIVVTILGILSGLGFMKFDKVQTKARENADYIAATNLATAANLCKNDKPDVIEDYEDGNGRIKLEELKKNSYINLIPKPQSLEGEFLILVDKDGSISVEVGNKILYPKE
ncbi:type II secretion system protein [Romboutsia sp.]|uniref:type II secretion system protein n=1 Tax=Romboutsia sp. TaxID=1965302 RepID=UPI003F385683